MAQDALKHSRLLEELATYFQGEGFKILSARGLPEFPPPEPIHNDGYGDQQEKVPDLVALDEVNGHCVLGVVRTGDGDFESEGALTEYNVYLDQTDRYYKKPYRVYLIAPSERIHELNALITHYIHREYWHKVIFVSSKEYEK